MGAVSSLLSPSGMKISVEERISYLKKTPFFLYLSEDALEEFARCFPNIIKAGEGESIKLESDRIYVVANGELELNTIIPPEGDHKIEARKYLCKKKPGDIVNMQQTKKDALRRVTSRKLHRLVDDLQTFACSKSLLLGIDQKSLDSFRSQHSDLTQYVDTIIKSHIQDYLSPLPFLKYITQSKLRVLAAMCRYEAFDANQTVFEENAFGTKLYIVLDGQATVFANNLNSLSQADREDTERASLMQRCLEGYTEERNIDEVSELVKLADLKKGDYFGETALIVHIPRTTTIKTTMKSLFLTVDKMDFENFLKVCPIREQILQVMKERMVSKLSSLGIPFLACIPSEKLSSLSSSANIHEMQEGDVVFREGDPGDRFYIIVYGNVKIETQNTSSSESVNNEEQDKSDETSKARSSITIGKLGPGNYFGEMALVNDSPRSATITALGKLVLLSVGKESFHQILDSNEQIHAEFNLHLLGESAELHHVLAMLSGINMFRSYLEKTFAEENLNFWLQVKSFHESDFQSDEELLATAKGIYEEFCEANSEHQINIPGNMRTELEQALERGKVDKHFFDLAEKEIYNLMVRDNYTRLKSTSDFKKFLNSLGILV